jgi:peptidyl-prolyl cis-trans isomerase D
MLQKIREKITGWVAWAIIITIGLVFAVWGIDLSFTPRTVAAKVNGEEVALEPVRRAYQDQVARFQEAFRGDLPEEIAGEIRRGVIEQFVRRELLQQRVEQQGYRVSDAALTEYVQSYDVFQVGGQFSMDAYRATLAGAGYTPAMFEAEQRRMLEIQQLQDAVVLSSFRHPKTNSRAASPCSASCARSSGSRCRWHVLLEESRGERRRCRGALPGDIRALDDCRRASISPTSTCASISLRR